MQNPFAAAEPQIKSYDPIWSQVRREAEEISAFIDAAPHVFGKAAKEQR